MIHACDQERKIALKIEKLKKHIADSTLGDRPKKVIAELERYRHLYGELLWLRKPKKTSLTIDLVP